MAVKAALFCTLIPRISVTAVDGGEPELELSDDPYDGQKLVDLLDRAPVLVTLSRIGNHCVVDPTPEEEACSSASLVMGVSPKGIFKIFLVFERCFWYKLPVLLFGKHLPKSSAVYYQVK